jgi:hypothetical protein
VRSECRVCMYSSVSRLVSSTSRVLVVSGEGCTLQLLCKHKQPLYKAPKAKPVCRTARTDTGLVLLRAEASWADQPPDRPRASKVSVVCCPASFSQICLLPSPKHRDL